MAQDSRVLYKEDRSVVVPQVSSWVFLWWLMKITSNKFEIYWSGKWYFVLKDQRNGNKQHKTKEDPTFTHYEITYLSEGNAALELILSLKILPNWIPANCTV